MRNTQFQQVSNRRGGRRRSGLGCVLFIIGALVVMFVLLLVLLPALPAIGLQVAGFQPAGRTEDILASEAAVQSFVGGGVVTQADNSADNGAAVSSGLNFTQASANRTGGSTPPSIYANAGQYGTFTFTPDEAVMQVNTGANGLPVLLVNITEAQALSMCVRRSAVCAGGHSHARNLTVDFHPGGAVIYADVKVPSTGIWQRGGGVARFNNATKQFDILGVDMDGTLYRAPEEVFGLSFDELVSEVNRVLAQVTLTANGTTFRLSEVAMGDGEITLILR